MVCAPVRSIIPSLKLGDYLSVQAHKPCSISHLFLSVLYHFQSFGVSVVSVRSTYSNEQRTASLNKIRNRKLVALV